MANTFTNLPAPAANGVGAAVDLSADGALKTFIVDGSWGLPPTVQIEMNDDAGQAGSWVPVTRSFQGRGEQTVEIVGRWFRVRVSNYRGGGAPAVNCGSNDNGTTLLNLPVPATTNGAGAAQASSTAGPFKTFCVQGPFRGVVNIEVSTDGATEWSVAATFSQPGTKNLVLTSNFVRAVRAGVPTAGPGTPIVTMASENASTGGGGSAITISANASSVSSGVIVFSNSYNVSFGLSGSTITASASGGAGGIAASASGSSVSGGTVVFSNSNNVSFGMSGSTITASIQALETISAGSTFATGPTIVFGNSNGLSFGVSGNTVTGSISQTLQPAVNLAAGTQTATSGTVAFSNSNGLTFGMSGSNQITGSFQAIRSLSAGTTQANGTQVVFSNANNVSFGANGNTITGSASFAQTPFALSGGASSQSTGTVVFSNAGGVSFGLNAGTMTASVAAQTPFAISGGASSQSTGTVVFSNGGGVSFGLNAGTMTASVASQVPETPFGISAGTQSVSTGTLVFSNSNGVSFGISGSSQMTAAVAAVKSIAFAGGGTIADSLTFSNQSGVSFVTNATNGRVVNAVVDAVRSISAGTTNATGNQIVFSNSNGVSFGANGATITASVAGGGGVALSAGTQSASSGTIVFANSNGISFALSGSSQVTASYDAIKTVVAGTMTLTNGQLNFINGASGISFVGNASSISGVAAARYGVSNLGNTAGSTGTVLAQYLFVGGSGVTLSQSTNGGLQGTLTINAGDSARVIQDPAQFAYSNALSQGGLSLYRMAQPFFATVTQARYAVQYALTTDGISTDAIVLNLGVYTMSGSTASLASSASMSITIAGGVPVNSTVPGLAAFSGFTFNMTPGDYLFAHQFRTTNSFVSSLSILGMSSVSWTAINNTFSASNTAQFVNGYSNASFSTALPASINVTNTAYVRTGDSANRQPSFQLLG